MEKSKKKNLIRRIIIGSSLSLVFFIVGCSIGFQTVSSDEGGHNDSATDKIINTLKSEWYSDIFYPGCTNEDAIIAQFVSSITNLELNRQLDPYTYVIKRATDTPSETRGKMGITITNTFDYPVITKVEKNSPAENKLEVDDIIYGIGIEDENGTVNYHYINEDDYGFSSLLAYGQGLIGDKTYVKYVRNNQIGQLIKGEACLTLEKVDSENIYAYSLPSGIEDTLYVKLNGFELSNGIDYTSTQLAEILEGNQDKKNIIIDLMDNGGGSLDSVINVCDLFLEKSKPIVSLQKKDGTVATYSTKKNEHYTFDNLYILQNGNTASASEIMVKAMSYYFPDNLSLIGNTTFGKGIAQKTIGINADYSLKYTFAKWLGPDNSYIEYKEGIEPDITTTKSELLTYMESHYPYLTYNDSSIMEFDTVSNNNIYLANILKLKGYDLRTDGYFDANYENAIKQYQINHNLEDTGKVNEDTFLYVVNDFINARNEFKYEHINEVKKLLA